MTILTSFTNLLGKLGIQIHIDNSRTNSPSLVIKELKVYLSPDNKITTIDGLRKELEQLYPLVKNDHEVNVSDKVKITESVLKSQGSLTMTKISSKPTSEDLELVQLARGNRPYDSISNVQITRDEKGNIISLTWNES